MNNTALIILAAGQSSRLGQPKQLLPYRGQTLLGHIVDEALQAEPTLLIVVTGAFEAEINPVLQEKNVEIVLNRRWAEGMASGIVAGLVVLLEKKPDIGQVIISACDQPYLIADLFQQMASAAGETEKGIVACSYGDTLGVPVLFKRRYFDTILSLGGEKGAKILLELYRKDVFEVPFHLGYIDIDTERDFIKLRSEG